MEVKDLIKNRRIELGLTMKDLAEKVGVSEATISRWESGEISNMKRSAIFALSKVLDISPDKLLGLSEFTPKDERDIQKRLQTILDELDDKAALNFYNGDEEMDEETKELLRISLESSIRLAKSRAKQKFIPNKYKDKKD